MWIEFCLLNRGGSVFVISSELIIVLNITLYMCASSSRVQEILGTFSITILGLITKDVRNG